MNARLLIVISATSTCTIELARDRVRHARQLLALLLKVLLCGAGAVLIEPVEGFLDGFADLFLVSQ